MEVEAHVGGRLEGEDVAIGVGGVRLVGDFGVRPRVAHLGDVALEGNDPTRREAPFGEPAAIAGGPAPHTERERLARAGDRGRVDEADAVLLAPPQRGLSGAGLLRGFLHRQHPAVELLGRGEVGNRERDSLKAKRGRHAREPSRPARPPRGSARPRLVAWDCHPRGDEPSDARVSAT